jgi:hypothetical protein
VRKVVIILSIFAIIAVSCRRKTENNPVRPINRQILDKLLPDMVTDYFKMGELQDSTQHAEAYLKQYFPNLEIFIDEDGIIRYGENLLVLTTIIDNKHIFAITYSEVDSLLVFYRLHDKQWKEIGQRKSEISVNMINFEELNGKPCLEIIASTFSNMNGNSWKECFVYFPKEDTIKYAGDFSTNYEVDLKRKTISEIYEGSFYMNPHKTLYIWHDDRLIALRTAEIIVPEDWQTNHKRTLVYYETYDYNYPMKMIFSETYNERNKKHRKYWDNFFEITKDEKQ